ncbi:hypothetical protein MPDQ_003579 [Monascus purpureus]|uniref:Pal1 cell morphology n=1 Tax=Monascus purpureus TaxID=5098 RepID=A0A507QKN4_MONPU|nr:hypothetical protein MPDQ_003579 [Monascus purpureus]BDD57723.1 hypothetical protein MAP00_003067 [Monascus purpureus]
MSYSSENWYGDTLPQRYSMGMVQQSFKSNNPYKGYPVPTMDFEDDYRLEPLEDERPSSPAPSVFFSASLEHHPVKPRKRHTFDAYADATMRRGRSCRHSSMVLPDVIDRLDNVSGYSYHHEGPYDAVYAERNRDNKFSPVAALKESNEEALKATPPDRIIDAINSHRPLDGTAFFAPGTADGEGRVYQYEEGANMMNEHGNFSRCPGQKFTDDDFKNDPFYNRPIPNRFTSFRKKLNFRHRLRRISLKA